MVRRNAHVTGIGGTFFAARNPTALRAWYRNHLGFPAEVGPNAAAASHLFKWREIDDPSAAGVTVWAIFAEGGEHLAGSRFMLNYRVRDLDGLLGDLAAGSIVPVRGPEDYDNGRFAWIVDPEGNRIELWEPKSTTVEAAPSAGTNAARRSPFGYVAIPCLELARAERFYAELTGRPLERNPNVPFPMSYFLDASGRRFGHLFQMESYAPSANGPIVYLEMDEDLNDVLARIERSGGRTAQAKQTLGPGKGYWALFLDTEGNRLALHSDR